MIYDLKQFSIRLFVCDEPSRAFGTDVKSHAGKNSCPKCLQEGIYKERITNIKSKPSSRIDKFIINYRKGKFSPNGDPW